MGVRRTRFLLIQYMCWGDCEVVFSMPRQKVVQLHLPAQYAGGWCRDHAIPPKIAFQNVHGDFLPFKSWAVQFRPPVTDRARHTSQLLTFWCQLTCNRPRHMQGQVRDGNCTIRQAGSIPAPCNGSVGRAIEQTGANAHIGAANPRRGINRGTNLT